MNQPIRSRLAILLLVSSVAAWGTSGCRPLESNRAASSSTEVEIREFQTASGVDVILVGGGVFELGSGVGAEGPRRSVTISPLVVDKFEVMQAELQRLQIPDASHFKGDRKPVEMIRWSEAVMVCNARSLAEGLEPCYDELTFECKFEASGYRLPTEAEWEFVARAGDSAPYPPGRPQSQLSRQACYSGNSGGETQEVGARNANAWGFHDLLGNVAEWCNDVYAEDAYLSAADRDPTGPVPDLQLDRVLRGGSWKLDEDDCRVTARFHDEPGLDDACFARDSYGFRMVRRPSAAELSQESIDLQQP